MSGIPKNLFHIINRFPEYKRALVNSFNNDTSFREMCEDYRSCLDALDHWQQSDRAESAARKQEYGLLLRELEGEILQSLKTD